MGRRPRLRFWAGRRVLTGVVVRLLITALVSLAQLSSAYHHAPDRTTAPARFAVGVKTRMHPTAGRRASRLVPGFRANGEEGAGTTRDEVLCDAAQQVAFDPGAPVGRDYNQVGAQLGRLLHDSGGWTTNLDDDLDVETFELALCHFAQLQLGILLRLNIELRGKARIRRDRGRQRHDVQQQNLCVVAAHNLARQLKFRARQAPRKLNRYEYSAPHRTHAQSGPFALSAVPTIARVWRTITRSSLVGMTRTMHSLPALLI